MSRPLTPREQAEAAALVLAMLRGEMPLDEVRRRLPGQVSAPLFERRDAR